MVNKVKRQVNSTLEQGSQSHGQIRYARKQGAYREYLRQEKGDSLLVFSSFFEDKTEGGA